MRYWPLLILVLPVTLLSGCSGEKQPTASDYSPGGLAPSPLTPSGSAGGLSASSSAGVGRGGGGGMPAAYSPMPPAPPVITSNLKADFTVTDKFEKGALKLEVLGICEVGEDSVECWSPSGVKDSDLTSKVQAGLASSLSESSPGPSIVTRFGLKNRMVIVSNQGARQGVEARITSWRVGSVSKWGAISVNLKAFGIDSPRPSAFEGARADMIAEPKDATQTSLTFVLEEPIREAPQLDCEIGKQVQFNGTTFTIKEIKRMMDSAWFVKIEADADPAALKPLDISFVPLDKDGRTFEWIKEGGVPISNQEKQAAGTTSQAAIPKTSRVRNTFEVLTMVDPQYVKFLSIRGKKVSVGKIVGIPLDPK